MVKSLTYCLTLLMSNLSLRTERFCPNYVRGLLYVYVSLLDPSFIPTVYQEETTVYNDSFFEISVVLSQTPFSGPVLLSTLSSFRSFTVGLTVLVPQLPMFFFEVYTCDIMDIM